MNVVFFSVKRQYPELSLLQLQRLIDVGRVDPSQPIDLTTLCNTKQPRILPNKNHYGINLTDEVSEGIYSMNSFLDQNCSLAEYIHDLILVKLGRAPTSCCKLNTWI